jgi:capsular polysaccharide biosynthesis protein/MinD-like ATPase involved in chromosome partitioning or flagellar assembly
MNSTTDAAAIFAPLWRRKWLILIVGLLVGAGSYFYYKRQPAVYVASTQLNLASGSEEQGLLGGQKTGLAKAAVSNAATIITSGVVAEEAHKLLRAEHANAKGKVRAKTSSTGSDIVTISAEAHGAKRAARLANAYALAYIKRERVAYVRAVKLAIFNTRQQLHRIELASAGAAKGSGSKSPSATNGTAVIQAANLSTKLNQLESELSVSGVQQISLAKASTAELIEPMPKQNAIFGFAFGVVLAMLGAFIVERFDRTLRTLGGVEGAFGKPCLAGLPIIKPPIVHRDGRPAVARQLLEPIRRVDTTMRLRESEAFGGASPRTIMCTSPDAGDGKSTLVAALALTRREAGERVAVIEADFRRPVMAKLLDVDASAPGLAAVMAGDRTVAEAVQVVPSAGLTSTVAELDAAAGGSTMVRTRARTLGSVSVLVGGASGGEDLRLADRAFLDLITTMAEDFDCVLIDAPSPVEVSDSITLLSAVEGILVVARLRHTSEVSAERLAELLALPSTAPVLGTVANAVSRRELIRSGFAPASGQRGRRSSSFRR